MQKITPFLWFDKEAREAAEFHASVFKDAKILDSITLENTPSGTVEVITIEGVRLIASKVTATGVIIATYETRWRDQVGVVRPIAATPGESP